MPTPDIRNVKNTIISSQSFFGLGINPTSKPAFRSRYANPNRLATTSITLKKVAGRSMPPMGLIVVLKGTGIPV